MNCVSNHVGPSRDTLGYPEKPGDPGLSVGSWQASPTWVNRMGKYSGFVMYPGLDHSPWGRRVKRMINSSSCRQLLYKAVFSVIGRWLIKLYTQF
jgi:hypothetical protein